MTLHQTISTMKKLNRFKLPLISLGIWLFCFVLYFATTPGNGYATTPEGAKTLGDLMSECSGGVFKYGDLGYRCDAYGPSKIASIIILISIISFILAIITFIVRLTSKAKN